MNLVIQAFLHLVVDLGAKASQAAEGRLNMAAGTAKAVIKIEVAKSRVEVVAPHQPHDAPSKPDTFRVAGRTVDRLRGFSEFIRPALVIFGGIGGRGSRFSRLVLSCRSAALGKGATDTDHDRQARDSDVTQNRRPELKHPMTHELPILFLLVRPLAMPLKWVPNAADTMSGFP